MAQDITLMGASFSDVPAVDLPKTGGGTARFTDVTDTTATASDVAQGKVFHLADGTQATGTSSGGGGGGASNIVQGEFNTGSTTLTTINLAIPYTGNGYPVAAMVYVKGGVYNNTSSGDTTWYNAVARYVIGFWSMVKNLPDVEPEYTVTIANDSERATTTSVYKNSSSSATTYVADSSRTARTFDTGAGANARTCVVFSSKNVMSVRVGSAGNYGLFADTTYEYYIVYSS